MIDADDQALIAGALIGLSAATAGLVGLAWWWLRR